MGKKLYADNYGAAKQKLTRAERQQLGHKLANMAISTELLQKLLVNHSDSSLHRYTLKPSIPPAVTKATFERHRH